MENSALRHRRFQQDQLGRGFHRRRQLVGLQDEQGVAGAGRCIAYPQAASQHVEEQAMPSSLRVVAQCARLKSAL